MEIKLTGEILSFADFRKYSNIFIETGSAMGDGIKLALSAGFERIKSVEAKDTYYNYCTKCFKDNKEVELFFGMSKDRMKEMLADINTPAVFFLDAHVSGENSAGHQDYLEKGNESDYAQDKCLIAEIEIILKNGINHIIIIDDQSDESLDENLKYRKMILDSNPSYKFFFYHEKRGQYFYENKIIVCIPQ